jgi:hypothetical protein
MNRRFHVRPSLCKSEPCHRISVSY